MTYLNKFSPKRLREIADGTRNPNGTKKLDMEKVNAKRDAERKKLFSIQEMRDKGLLQKASAITPKSDRAKAMKLADKWFSQFIRLRDSDADGMCVCITNPKVRKHWKQMDCGHWISRAKMAVRYDERNANAQSKQSNRFQGGHFLEHGQAIDRKHGEGTRAALEEKVRRWDAMRAQMKAVDLEFIADTYKKRVELMRANDPGKFRTI